MSWSEENKKFMQMALDFAEEALQEGEVPSEKKDVRL